MKKNDVEKTLKKGLVSNTPHVTIYTLANPIKNNQLKAQVAVVVSKKVHASAVQRHKYQRWMREIVAGLREETPNNLMFVLIAKPSIREVSSFVKLQEALSAQLIKQVERLKNLSKNKP